MNHEREMGMAVMMAMFLWVIICLLAMCSCSGRKVVTEYVEVHDTLIVNHSDTVSVDRWHVRHDTLRVETERVVTLLKPDKSLPAETIRVETNNYHWQKEVVNDSTTKFVAKVDSILRALDKEHNKETERQKNRMPWWGWIAIGGSATIGCLGLLKSRVL